MKLCRHQEADETLAKGPNFDVEDCTKYFGPIGNANLLVVRAQVDMAIGRLVFYSTYKVLIKLSHAGGQEK